MVFSTFRSLSLSPSLSFSFLLSTHLWTHPIITVCVFLLLIFSVSSLLFSFSQGVVCFLFPPLSLSLSLFCAHKQTHLW